MNTEELTMLLTRIQVLDNRQVDQLTIEAWEPLVAGVEYEDAVEAVNEHFRTSERYLQPVHVIEGAASSRRSRIAKMVRTPHDPVWAESADKRYCTLCLRDEEVHGKRHVVEMIQACGAGSHQFEDSGYCRWCGERDPREGDDS